MVSHSVILFLHVTTYLQVLQKFKNVVHSGFLRWCVELHLLHKEVGFVLTLLYRKELSGKQEECWMEDKVPAWQTLN